MRMKVAAILCFAFFVLLVEESHGWGIRRLFVTPGRIFKQSANSYNYVRNRPGKYYRRGLWDNKVEISKLRELKEKDEEAYKNAMFKIANETAEKSGDGKAQIMTEMLDELVSMPDEKFNQFMTEQELEQIADSDELLLRISEKEFSDGQTDEPTPSY